jgi:hypothetical protein
MERATLSTISDRCGRRARPGHESGGESPSRSCSAAALDPALRVVVAEEVFEADIPLPNVANMHRRVGCADREPGDLRAAGGGVLRVAPDLAIVGKVRDGRRSREPHGYANKQRSLELTRLVKSSFCG